MNINITQPTDTYPANAAEEFPLVLAACQKFEKANDRASLIQFEIGDALIAELGDHNDSGVNDGSIAKIDKISGYLAANGLKYSRSTLQNIMATTRSFPAPLRRAPAAFSVHKAACMPGS